MLHNYESIKRLVIMTLMEFLGSLICLVLLTMPLFLVSYAIGSHYKLTFFSNRNKAIFFAVYFLSFCAFIISVYVNWGWGV